MFIPPPITIEPAPPAPDAFAPGPTGNLIPKSLDALVNNELIEVSTCCPSAVDCPLNDCGGVVTAPVGLIAESKLLL